MKLIYLKSALKCNSFDVAIDIKIQFFRVLVTIEPGRSLLQFVTTNCLMLRTSNDYPYILKYAGCGAKSFIKFSNRFLEVLESMD